MNASFLLTILVVRNPRKHSLSILHFHSTHTQTFHPILLAFSSLFIGVQDFPLIISFPGAEQHLLIVFDRSSVYFNRFAFFEPSMYLEITSMVFLDLI